MVETPLEGEYTCRGMIKPIGSLYEGLLASCERSSSSLDGSVTSCRPPCCEGLALYCLQQFTNYSKYTSSRQAVDLGSAKHLLEFDSLVTPDTFLWCLP